VANTTFSGLTVKSAILRWSKSSWMWSRWASKLSIYIWPHRPNNDTQNQTSGPETLMLHYQRQNGIYCINSLAICKESTPSSLVMIFFLSVYRQSFICITFLLNNYLGFRHVVHY
jgi:hypothetical protein